MAAGAALAAFGTIASSIIAAKAAGGGDSSTNTFLNTNPFAGILAGFGGLGSRVVSGGTLFGDARTQDPDRRGRFLFQQRAPTLFDTETLQNIVDFVSNPLPLSDATAAGRAAIPGILEGGLGLIEDFSNNFTIPAAAEAVQTGFANDPEPFAEAARNRLFRETVPSLTEQFAGTAGIQSSDFGRELIRAGRDVDVSIANKGLDLAESASQRRLAALTAGPAAALSGPALALALIDSSTRLGGAVRGQEEEARPGARALTVLQTLMGLGGPSSLGTVGNIQEQGGGNLAALGNVIGSLSAGFNPHGLFNRQTQSTPAFVPPAVAPGDAQSLLT